MKNLRLGATLCLIPLALNAQTTVYLRASGPAAAQITGATNTTPIVVQTSTAHGLTVGDVVVLVGVCTGTGASPVNGIRKVGATSLDATHFSITDLAGTEIAGAGTYINCQYAPGGSESAKWVGKLTPYVLGPQPLGWLDGPTGVLMRKLALGTSNGLTSLVVFSNVATATTSYAHGIMVGDQIAVWNSANTTLNGSPGTPYTITAATETTFQFSTSGVSNGTYSGMNNTCGPAPTPNDIIGGSQDCLRISQLAYRGNPIWDSLIVNSDYSNFQGIAGPNVWKSPFDGGVITTGTPYSIPYYYALAATRFLVDQSNAQLLSIVTYALNRIERIAGVNWTCNESLESCGNIDFNDWGSQALTGISWLYLAGSPYLSAPHKHTFLDKIYNDIDDVSVTPSSKSDADLSTAHNRVLAAGLAQTGSSATIILAASDTQADNYYVNNVIMLTASGQYGLVTRYVASTKVATVSAPWTSPPTTGTAYTIYATISISSSVPTATANITGYNTKFTTDFSVGDGIIGSNAWTYQPGVAMSYITTINSDTSLTVINNVPTASMTPSIAWSAPKWRTGDVGLIWHQKHWPGYPGAQPLLYPQRGGDLASYSYGPADGSNNDIAWAFSHMVLGLVAAPDDARAVRDLAIAQSYGFDYELRHYMNYVAGPAHSGGTYSYAVLDNIGLFAAALAGSIPTFPSMDLTGPWLTNVSLYKLFSIYPDLKASGSQPVAWPIGVGAETGDNEIGGRSYPQSGYYLLDPAFQVNPTSRNAQYLRYFLEHATFNLWGYNGLINYQDNLALIHNDPRIQSRDYSEQPLQYAFIYSSATACAALTGWPCPMAFRGDAVISRTSWTDRAATMLYYGSRTFASDHDLPENGTLRIHKVGGLLNVDSVPGLVESNGWDMTTQGDMMQFGGSGATVKLGPANNQIGMTPITSWASANHGTWDPGYGDQTSTYMYTCSDLSGAYTVALNYAQRCVAHLKKPGTEEMVIQWDSASASKPTQIETHLHYVQNGQAAYGQLTYSEGQTTCPGPGGCAALNSTRAIQSLEDGGSDPNNPSRIYGILTTVLSPGLITLRDDGSAYPGAYGYSHRVSVCAGASCGSTASVFEALIVHKISQNYLTDLTLTASPLNPDANWTGVQTFDKVVVLARGGTTHSSMSGFTTTHKGVGQYLFGGLTAGTYIVTVNGSPVAGSPFSVAAGSDAIEFESTAGAVSMNGGSGPSAGWTLSGKVTLAAAPPATIPPSVVITAPSGGSVVSHTVAVTATAVQGVSLANVQFQLDGVNLGAELASAPYSISWNTTTARNGIHDLTAIGRDALQNVTTSAVVPVTVNNTVTGPSSAGLIGYWNFDEGSGGIAYDTSGSGYDGTVIDASWVTGKINAGLSFSGTSSVVTPMISLSNTVSISAWVNPAVSPQGGWARIAETQYGVGFYLGTNEYGTKYKVIVNGASGSTGTCVANFGCAEGGTVSSGWHLVTATFDGTSARLYVDSVLVASDTVTAPPDSNLPLYIGRYYGASEFGWNGAIDDVRLYNRALTADEVAGIFNYQIP